MKQLTTDSVPVRLAKASPHEYDLTAAAKEFTFFVPHVLLMVFPKLKLNPVVYAGATHNFVPEVTHWSLDQRILDLGAYGRQNGLSENVIFGVPTEQWNKVENTAITMMVNTPEELWHVIVQTCPIQIGTHKINLLAFVLESPTKIVACYSDDKIIGTPSMYKVETRVGGDSKLAVAYDALHNGGEFHKPWLGDISR